MNILKIERMDFCYKQQFVLKDFVLSIAEGSIYSLVGKPKSGKTTALKLILGLLKTTASTVYIKGQDFYNRRESLQSIVGAIIDLPYYQNYLTVKQNFLYIDMLFGYGDLRIAEVLRFIGLAKYTNTKVKKLTITQQKFLSVGIALYHNPDLLVFDDLLRDLDEDSKGDICKLLLKIKKKGGTILMSSRSIDDIRSFSTHIGILENGKIYKEVCSQELKSERFQNADLLV
ncbi:MULTISPECIES: ATP-binding cassette domain-containing protein [unclassified Dysgonomonas]|uniref:ATP-binding cassette domain-containing protein n=1 Tax=unclassified Dysgonomonas TaxID=2630389 RepID=UPI00067FCE72|nr:MULTISPECIES: ATP-binding cassette domain-containing protein [unclassified Dysgonomonas]MBD8348542.1 ATP-binding cassette domain-containing protein [Dysgonomonas sp. HGC4]MBF0576055.1 ATP-binding cassette domain-containing protein [Dysgonomonas sp. GY617]